MNQEFQVVKLKLWGSHPELVDDNYVLMVAITIPCISSNVTNQIRLITGFVRTWGKQLLPHFEQDLLTLSNTFKITSVFWWILRCSVSSFLFFVESVCCFSPFCYCVNLLVCSRLTSLYVPLVSSLLFVIYP